MDKNSKDLDNYIKTKKFNESGQGGYKGKNFKKDFKPGDQGGYKGKKFNKDFKPGDQGGYKGKNFKKDFDKENEDSFKKRFKEKIDKNKDESIKNQNSNSQQQVQTKNVVQNVLSKTPEINGQVVQKKPEWKQNKEQRQEREPQYSGEKNVVFKEPQENVKAVEFEISEQRKLLNKHIRIVNNVEIDSENRFHSGIKSKGECDKNGGYWDSNSGVCWQTQQEKKCNIYDSPDLIDSKKVSKMDFKQRSKKIAETRGKCNMDEKCFFNKKSDSNEYHCFDKTNYFKKNQGSKDLVLPEQWIYNVNNPNFQKLLYYYYTNLLETPVMKHISIPKKMINMCDKNNQKMVSPKFNLAQFMVRIMAKTLIEAEKRKIKQKTRGLLCWWSTGSGKAAGASAIMNEYLDTNKRIVYATSVEAIRANEDTIFYNNMRLYIDRFNGMSVEEIKKQIGHRIIFKSFAQMAHLLQLEQPLKVKDVEYYKNYLQDCVLVIDEVQDLFQPIANQQKEYDAFRKLLLDNNNPLTCNLHVYLLSATPGDTPKRIISLLNILRAPGTAPIVEPQSYSVAELREFKDAVRGMVSYYNQNLDYTRFPVKSDKNIHMIGMSEVQYKDYLSQMDKITSYEQDLESLIKSNKTDEYFKRLRRYSNSMLKWDKQNLTLFDYSAKMAKVVSIVDKEKFQKHYVYSSYYRNMSRGEKQKWDHGVFAIGNILTSEKEYEFMPNSECRRIYQALKLDNIENRENTSLQGYLSKKKRYVIASSTAIGEDGKLDYIVGLFNHKDNAYGEYIQVFLASQKYNQSIDLKSLRHIHFVEPLLMRSADLQLVGRGVRSCSHAQLNFPDEWNVQIHRYFSAIPDSHQKVFDKKQFEDSIEQYLQLRQDILTSISSQVNRIKQGVDNGDNTDTLQDVLVQYYTQLNDIDNYYYQIIKAYQEYQINNKENTIDIQIMFQQIQISKKINKLESIMREGAVDCQIMKEIFGYDLMCDSEKTENV